MWVAERTLLPLSSLSPSNTEGTFLDPLRPDDIRLHRLQQRIRVLKQGYLHPVRVRDSYDRTGDHLPASVQLSPSETTHLDLARSAQLDINRQRHAMWRQARFSFRHRRVIDLYPIT